MPITRSSTNGWHGIMEFPEFTEAVSAGSLSRTTISAGDYSPKERCWQPRLIRTAHRRSCGANGCSTTYLACLYRRLRQESIPTWRRTSPARRRSRYASGSRNTDRVLLVTVVIRSSIRWGSRWRILTPSVDGGALTNRGGRLTRAAPRWAARRSRDFPGCGRCCSINPSNFRVPSLRNFWLTLLDEESNTTISRP